MSSVWWAFFSIHAGKVARGELQIMTIPALIYRHRRAVGLALIAIALGLSVLWIYRQGEDAAQTVATVEKLEEQNAAKETTIEVKNAYEKIDTRPVSHDYTAGRMRDGTF